MVWYEDWTGIVKKQPVSGGEKKKKKYFERAFRNPGELLLKTTLNNNQMGSLKAKYKEMRGGFKSFSQCVGMFIYCTLQLVC